MCSRILLCVYFIIFLYFFIFIFISMFLFYYFLNCIFKSFLGPKAQAQAQSPFLFTQSWPNSRPFSTGPTAQQAQKGPFSSGLQTWPKACSQRPYQNRLQITRPTRVASSPSRTRARPSMDPLLCDSASPAWHADVFPLPPTNSQATHAKVCCV